MRRIDWNLFGRLERLFLKLYEEERELPVLYLDFSESMSFGRVSKFDFARQVAAAVGYVALCGFDRVTVEPFPLADDQAGLVGELRAVRGRRSAMRFFDNLNRLKAGGTADFNQALRLSAMKHRAQGVIVVLSDFLDPAGYEDGLNSLASRGSEVHAVQILAPEELEPSSYGTSGDRFRDRCGAGGDLRQISAQVVSCHGAKLLSPLAGIAGRGASVTSWRSPTHR